MVSLRDDHPLDEVVDHALALACLDVKIDTQHVAGEVCLDEPLESAVRAAGERARRSTCGDEVVPAGADEVLYVGTCNCCRAQSAPVLAAALSCRECPRHRLQIGRHYVQQRSERSSHGRTDHVGVPVQTDRDVLVRTEDEPAGRSPAGSSTAPAGSSTTPAG